MSVGGTTGRVVAAALAALAALAAVAASTGSATATPNVPLPADDPPAPVVPFDPGALVGAINDYAGLLSILTGGHRAQPGRGGGAPVPTPAPAPPDPYPMLPGLG